MYEDVSPTINRKLCCNSFFWATIKEAEKNFNCAAIWN